MELPLFLALVHLHNRGGSLKYGSYFCHTQYKVKQNYLSILERK